MNSLYIYEMKKLLEINLTKNDTNFEIIKKYFVEKTLTIKKLTKDSIYYQHQIILKT